MVKQPVQYGILIIVQLWLSTMGFLAFIAGLQGIDVHPV